MRTRGGPCARPSPPCWTRRSRRPGLEDWGFTAGDIDAFVDGISGCLDNDPVPDIDTDLVRRLYAESFRAP
ncbi:hypothetical protein [Streptomyces syringium]|uniref:hypothetical protein n=1 Tax=Streptomyces syringium TaxID=76729 RepID=UPI00343985EB